MQAYASMYLPTFLAQLMGPLSQNIGLTSADKIKVTNFTFNETFNIWGDFETFN